MLAVVASQTLLKKLGNAFWDAFSGGGSSTVTSSGAGAGNSATKKWDADKVRKVLEGKAVVRVVDVDSPTTSPTTAITSTATSATSNSPANLMDTKKCCVSLSEILEESMRSLSISKSSSSTSAGSEKEKRV
jgi:hypothetical protein